MQMIEIKRPNPDVLKELGVTTWSPWECPVSTFDWEYADTERCYLYEGHVEITTPWQTLEIKQGDLVTFPRGLTCTWKVLAPVKKVYIFEEDISLQKTKE